VSGPVDGSPTVVVFDIDGTLLASAGEHHAIIERVLARRGLDVLAKPWAAYRHYTDSAVIDEVFLDQVGRGVTPGELAELDREYLAEFLLIPPVRQIAGARRLLTDLAETPEVVVTFATGSLRSLAMRKLALLGVDAERSVLATGGEHRTREAIVCAALAGARARSTGRLRAIALGDGIWDERTALGLGLPFVAVQTGTHVFGDAPVATVTDLTTLTAADLVALAGPVPEGILPCGN